MHRHLVDLDVWNQISLVVSTSATLNWLPFAPLSDLHLLRT